MREKPTASDNRRRLRAFLSGPTLTIAPSCADALTALLIEHMGFRAVHLSGNAAHRSAGMADAGLLTLVEMADRAASIAERVNMPVIADAETGYGGLANVARTVRAFERAGVAGLHVEDQVTPKSAHDSGTISVISVEEMVAKIKTAVDARTDPEMVIISRSDARAVTSLEAVIERQQACVEAGADAIWVSARNAGEVAAFVKAFEVPLIGIPPRQAMTIVEYGQLGVHVALLPGTLALAALHGMREALIAIRDQGADQPYLESLPGIAEVRSWYSQVGMVDLQHVAARVSL